MLREALLLFSNKNHAPASDVNTDFPTLFSVLQNSAVEEGETAEQGERSNTFMNRSVNVHVLTKNIAKMV